MTTPPIPRVPGILIPKYCGQCAAPLAPKLIKSGEPERLACTSCGIIHWLEPKVAAGILLLWNGELVLGQRGIEPGYGSWIFPGGFVDRGETLPDAARREAREEIGVEVADVQLLNVYSYPGHPVILVAFTGEIVGGTPQARDETLAVECFPLDRIPYEKLAFRSTAEAVRDFLAWRSRKC